MAQISIIIPIYKAEKYIDRCISSITNQTFQDFELVLVIDGSPDNSLSICKWFAQSDSRIKIISQKNSGAHSARLAGFKISSAPYITFVDADDYLPPEALQTLYSIMLKGYDIVKGVDIMHPFPKISFYNIDLDNKEFFKKTYLGEIPAYLWGTLYKRSLFNEYVFNLCISNKLLIGEDWITNLYIGQYINRAIIINKGVYYYCVNKNGVMSSTFMSDGYRNKITNIVNSILDMSTPQWQYLYKLKQAIGITELFIPERGFISTQYKATKEFVKSYTKTPLSQYVKYRFLLFINYEYLFRFYTWLYRTCKWIIKYKCHKRKIIT